jgi:hypothetical protein
MPSDEHGGAQIEEGSVWVRTSTGEQVRACAVAGDSLYAENVKTGRRRWWRAASFVAAHDLLIRRSDR